MEKGESYSDAMIREVKEETGLTIERPMLTGVYHWEKDATEHVVFLYKTDKYTGELQSSDEVKVWDSGSGYLSHIFYINITDFDKFFNMNKV